MLFLYTIIQSTCGHNTYACTLCTHILIPGVSNIVYIIPVHVHCVHTSLFQVSPTLCATNETSVHCTHVSQQPSAVLRMLATGQLEFIYGQLFSSRTRTALKIKSYNFCLKTSNSVFIMKVYKRFKVL